MLGTLNRQIKEPLKYLSRDQYQTILPIYTVFIQYTLQFLYMFDIT